MAEIAQKIAGLREGVVRYAEAAPEAIKAFKTLGEVICEKKDGVLDCKTKELIAMAVAVARQCEPCILSHLEAGIKAGMTREELVEATNIAILLCGGPGYAYASYALTWYDELIQKI